ncbi:MAG: T9SS type A sorting domain-containing protein [Candidatus Cloacimonetes bacterium]|nr:T9SS type A sorting domain-containing protein [Candidatus Cloacimonadota bacterium]
MTQKTLSNQKHRLVLLFFVLLLQAGSLAAYVDTLYTVPGYAYALTTYPYGIIRVSTGGYDAGDTGIGYIPPISPNDTHRSYMTFDLIEFSKPAIIDSVKLRLFVASSFGNDIWNDLPIWNVTNGDTVKLSIDLIDYGGQLDVGDWTAGDQGNPQTLLSRVHHVNFDGITSVPITTYSDVTEAFLYTMNHPRDVIQFRIKYDIDTDYDDLYDQVNFSGGWDPVYGYALLVYWRDSTSVADNELPAPNRISINVAPNPTRNEARFALSAPQDIHVQAINIYDIRGRKVTSIQVDERGTAVWDRRDASGHLVASGIYFCKVTDSNSFHVARKVLVIN